MPIRSSMHLLVSLPLAILTACSAGHPEQAPVAPATPAPIVPAFPGKRPSMREAAARFAAMGVQPGQALPALSLVDLEGRPTDLATTANDRPLVLVACSLTCSIARRQQTAVAELQRRFADTAAIVMVYTIEAHPKGDPCPYSGEEWVPIANEHDDVLVRQPTTLEQRLKLAARYAKSFAPGATVLCDTMDNASWRTLGEAPNVGVCVDRDGIVVARTGWFDGEQIAAALARIVGG